MARVTAADRREYVRSAAIEYAINGWGVVPGSVWDGQRYTQGHTPLPTVGLRPVMVSGRTLRTEREVWSWWSVAPYSPLARAGEDFDVLAAPSDLVRAAMEVDGSAVLTCPIMRSPDGVVARLLICKGSRLRRELREITGVALVPGGVLVPLPPTLCADGSWAWWIDPAESNHRPGLAGATQAALASAASRTKAGNP